MAISGGDGSIILTTKVDESGLSSGLSKLKRGVGAFGKAFAVAGAAGVTAFVGITKAAVDSYAEFEQLKGGVETLFKDSAGQLMKYADQAYKAAGLSANEYMATVTSFSASLLQSLGGDTEKAANYADQAIIDMSDNANKMGTSMESIQYAYQGFAKQNYTMLDNLKLGYGGTKEEMQRLLEDAEKISGIKYDISSFADVTQAIHVIQTELGITGTTALEASSTIQGSASAMKASWQNLLTGMADPTQDFNALLQNFITSIGTFASNLLPVITTATQGVLQMVQGLLPQIPVLIEQMLPIVIEGVSGIIAGLVEVLPQIVNAVMEILPQLVTAILNMLPQILKAGIQILLSLIQGLTQALPQLIAMLPEIINTIITVLIENLPLIIEAGVQLLMAVIEGLTQAMPQLIGYVPTIVDTMITTLLDNLPLLIDCAIQLLVAIITGLIQALPQLVAMTPQIILTIVTTLMANLPLLLQAGVQLLQSVIEGIGLILSKIGEVGKNIVEGLWEGIKKAKDWLLGKIREWCGSILNGIKAFFRIESPSKVMRDEVGAMLVRGLELGIRKTSHVAVDAMRELGNKLIDEAIEAAEESAKAFEETTKKIESKSTTDSKSDSKKYNKFAVPSATNPDLVMSNDERAQALGYKDFRDLMKNEYQRMTRDHNRFQVEADSEEEAALMWSAFMSKDKILSTEELWSKPDENGVRDLIDKRIIIKDKNGKTLYNRQQLVPIERTAEAIEKANKEITESQEQANIDIRQMLTDVKQSAKANEKIVVSDAETAKERVEQLKEFKSTYEKQLNEINKLEEDYATEAKRIQEQLNRDIQEVIEDYQNSFENRAEGVISSLSLFEKAEKGEATSGTQMVIALRSQVNVLEDYKTALDELSKREVSTAFIEEMSSLGVDALPQLEAFNKMTDAQLDEYVALWEEKSNLANEATEIALAQQRDRTKQQIQDLKDTANQESATLYMEYNTAMLELLEQVSTGMQEVGDAGIVSLGEYIGKYVDMGKQLMAGVAEGLKQNNHLVGEELISSIKGAMSGIKNQLGIQAPADYESGNYSISVPALARGSVLPGGKPFLAIVNDQPRGQTNIEAPLQTIVDAMNIALDNNGRREVITEEHYHLNETELMTILHKLVKGGERIQGRSLISGGAY